MHLQEAYQADINLLLFCIWVGRQRQLLTGEQLRTVAIAVMPVRQQEILPLRARRRSLVGTSAAVANQKQALLVRELAAEQKEQSWLYQWWYRQQPLLSQQQDAVQANLRNYLQQLDLTRKQVESTLKNVDQIFD